jgi:putative PIN family toxin of toxin-antitoxin system
MIVVLDNNILISGIFWEHGNPRRIIDKWKNGDIQIAVSEDTLNELIGVIEREFEMSSDDISYWRKLISENSIIVCSTKKYNLIKVHDADNKFIDVAAESGAEYIVSGDKHLLELKNVDEVKIITAKEMVDILVG